MSEWIALGLVALALYVIECIVWIEAAAVACFKTPRHSWKCAEGSALPGNERGGLLVADPTNPCGSVVVSRSWPFSVSPDGITNLSPLDDWPAGVEPLHFPFDDIKTVRTELGEIQINGARFIRLSSSDLAIYLTEQIHRFWNHPVHERAAEIRLAVEETFDVSSATSTWRDFRRRTRALRTCCSILFGYTFVLCPTVLFLIGPYPTWQYLLAGWMAITLAIAILYFRTHSAMFPHCRYERWVHALSMMVLPVAAIRCIDKLSREVLSRFSPLVVPHILCGTEGALALIRRQAIDISSAPTLIEDASVSSPAAQCARWFGRLLAEEMRFTLERLNIDIHKPPSCEDESMVSYCPRCHSQFGRVGTACADCPRVALIAFATEEHAGEKA